MGAPTSRRLDKHEQPPAASVASVDDDEVMVDVTAVPSSSSSVPVTNNGDIDLTSTSTTTTTNTTTTMDSEGKIHFASVAQSNGPIKQETRSIPVPRHRYAQLRAMWKKIYVPLVEQLRLQVKMDPRHNKVMIRTCKDTTDPGAIQKGADFLRAFCLGFDVDDAIALIRLDDLYIETFEIKDVKTLEGDHLSRAIGRIAGKDGKTKFAIENASRTRVVLADSKIHILGGFSNIKIARETIVSLILGAPPGKVYGNLRIISSRMKERF